MNGYNQSDEDAPNTVSMEDLDWLMELVIKRASNDEYHRAKDILLKLGAVPPNKLPRLSLRKK